MAADPVRISLVPESGQLVAGIENQLDLFLSDPLGAPVGGLPADVVLAGESHAVTTDAFGHARLAWVPAPGQTTARVDLGLERAPVSKTFNFSEQAGDEHLLVRTDRAVYEVGEDVQVEVRTSSTGTVFIDWLNEGQAVDMRTLQAQDGVARFTMPIDTSLVGENRINAYVVEPDGNIVRSSRSVFARGGSQLSISMQADRSVYAPGQPAQLSFTVTDQSGAPAVAALGVQIVDQAVFAVVDAKPGLLSSYFELEDDFAQPRYELEAPGGDLADLLLQQTTSGDAASRGAAQTRAAANLAALGAVPLSGVYAGSWSATVQQSKGLLAPFFEAQKARMIKALQPVAASAVVELQGRGCQLRDYYCSALQQSFPQALHDLLPQRFAAYDFWGNAFTAAASASAWNEALRLTSAGPDERPGTADDATISISYTELQLQQALVELGIAPNDAARVAEGPAAPPQATADNNGPGAGGSGGTSGGDTGSGSPRLRQDFPET
ncbi:MAG TPA: alpha-2-macroglobulin, partial [Polyangiaceae bacterium]|nr:alpha-2-macroglobulin [Polyangiaceae bacterium]